MKAKDFLDEIMGESSNSVPAEIAAAETSPIAKLESQWQPAWNTHKNAITQSNHTKSFKTPDELWAAACDYFDYVQKNPIIKKEFIKTGPYAGTEVPVEVHRPFNWSGLNVYLTTNGITSSLYRYRYNDGDAYSEFQGVIKLIDDVMFNQKFEGAVVGIFKENIIAREIGLADKSNVTVASDQPLFEL